jgi:hypothetical protein
MNSYPDPYANPRRNRFRRSMLLIACAAMFLVALLFLKESHRRKSEAQDALEAVQSAAALLPSEPARRVVAAVDPKQKIFLSELRSTAAKLSIDWGARLAKVEQALGSELSLNSLRIDAQKGEMELKGETSSNEKLTALIGAMQRSGLDARVSRMGRLANGLEYSVLIAWPP